MAFLKSAKWGYKVSLLIPPHSSSSANNPYKVFGAFFIYDVSLIFNGYYILSKSDGFTNRIDVSRRPTNCLSFYGFS